MGSQPIQLLTQFLVPVSINWSNFTSRGRRWRCFSGGRSGGSRWEQEKKANPNRGSKFSDTYVTDEYSEEDYFRFRNTAKQRVWWSDDLYQDYDDDEEDGGFRILEASIGFDWILEVFQSFGWMIPAVIISFLMGTGPDSIIMTLALPLAQSAFYFAADMLLGKLGESPRPRKKKKRRPSVRNRTKLRKEKETRSANNYKSWLEGNNVSSKKETNWQDFGGWDELDKQVRADVEPRKSTVKRGNEPKADERTEGDSQLLMRFLIAMFPFLGFWTKLFSSM